MSIFAGKAAAWTAVFTFALTVFSGLLWWVNRQAGTTSVVTQRAFVTYGGMSVVKLPEDTKPEEIKPPTVANKARPQAPVETKLKGINVYFTWANSGTTPTKTLVMERNVAVGLGVPQKGIDFDRLPQGEKTGYVLGPKAAVQMQPVFVSIDDVEAAAAGKKHIFFWGWLVYHDVFENTPVRLSEFCIDFSDITWTKPDHRDFSGDISFATPPCPVHNCYDEGCEDYRLRAQQAFE